MSSIVTIDRGIYTMNSSNYKILSSSVTNERRSFTTVGSIITTDSSIVKINGSICTNVSSIIKTTTSMQTHPNWSDKNCKVKWGNRTSINICSHIAKAKTENKPLQRGCK